MISSVYDLLHHDAIENKNSNTTLTSNRSCSLHCSRIRNKDIALRGEPGIGDSLVQGAPPVGNLCFNSNDVTC